MSGAAGIAAAKNRRSKPDPNQKPIISCNSKTGSCPLPTGSKSQTITSTSNVSNNIFNEDSMQITGPMPLMHVLKIHEHRLNKIDETIKQKINCDQQTCTDLTQNPAQHCNIVCVERIDELEEKIRMLEEVIMNLQLTLTNVQNFAMESSLAMLKLQNQVSAPVISAPVSPIIEQSI